MLGDTKHYKKWIQIENFASDSWFHFKLYENFASDHMEFLFQIADFVSDNVYCFRSHKNLASGNGSNFRSH